MAEVQLPTRSTFWTRTFQHARTRGGWLRVPRLYTRATAVQLSSDISNSHHRNATALRVRGIEPHERWEARWEPAEDGPLGDHAVWVRLVSSHR